MHKRYDIHDLRYLMKRLRDPNDGCPWDLKQTPESIVPFTLEEVYELIEALEINDRKGARDELGDVLFQVVFYAQLAEEQGWFALDDVIHGIVLKLLRRHPHVFPDGTLGSRASADRAVDEIEVKERWEDIKQVERDARDQRSVMDDVPLTLPALSRAQKLQKRARRVGLDWKTADEVLEVFRGELTEFQSAMQEGAPDALSDELGDLLFTCVNLARVLDLDAEQLLRQSSRKFETRVRRYTELARQSSIDLSSPSDEERDQLWAQAKQELGSQCQS